MRKSVKILGEKCNKYIMMIGIMLKVKIEVLYVILYMASYLYNRVN